MWLPVDIHQSMSHRSLFIHVAFHHDDVPWPDSGTAVGFPVTCFKIGAFP
jgi:hypothetical protein